jgi:hypothetical protein
MTIMKCRSSLRNSASRKCSLSKPADEEIDRRPTRAAILNHLGERA